jgi:hypothetical protein
MKVTLLQYVIRRWQNDVMGHFQPIEPELPAGRYLFRPESGLAAGPRPDRIEIGHSPDSNSQNLDFESRLHPACINLALAAR